MIDAIARVPRYFYAFRNDLCTANGVEQKKLSYILRRIFEYAACTVKSKDGKKLRLQTMWKGMRAGVKFDPEIEYLT